MSAVHLHRRIVLAGNSVEIVQTFRGGSGAAPGELSWAIQPGRERNCGRSPIILHVDETQCSQRGVSPPTSILR